MSKMKSSRCLFCNKGIPRHDPNRVSIRVGENNGQVAYKEAHLACSQREQQY